MQIVDLVDTVFMMFLYFGKESVMLSYLCLISY